MYFRYGLMAKMVVFNEIEEKNDSKFRQFSERVFEKSIVHMQTSLM